MQRAKSVALIGAGKLTDSPVARFWGLSDQLGPVKSPSFRLASRLANSLRAGHPVKDYADFGACHLILISVPDEMLPQVVSELAAAEISWPDKAVVLCSTWLDSSALAEIAAQGASIGSLSTIPGFEDTVYLVEGDRLAILEARRLVEHRQRRVVPIERALKPFYLAALTCTGPLLFALLLAASESLRHAGVASSTSSAILEKQLGKTLRSYVKAGRKAYPPPQELASQLLALSVIDPELAQFLEQSAALAARLLEKR
jgi:predicted short-subunit dehydrogenase-like oxidoreductase (DUF2520 family)